MKPFIISLVSFFFLTVASGQRARTLKVYDRFNNVPISRAACIIMNAEDSTILLYGRTNSNGTIRFNKVLPFDSLIFLIIHHKFVEPGFVKLNNFLDTFYLFPKNKILSQVNITTNKAITLSGDTITYVADSFKLKENASVEDLLKKLPGIQIAKDGTIKANGERVERVLVDGDDFFGENASIATKNLDAKMIDRVEIIDAQSKKAKSTGVDDGEKVKVINLKLKENAKKGFFGKLEAGATNTKRYLGNAMVNVFTDAVKASSYLLADNMNNFASWNDRNDFGLNNNWQYDEDLDMWITNDGLYENDFGVIPRKIQGGAFYSQKFKDKKGKISVKYAYRGKNINGTQSVNNKIIYENKTQNSIQENKVNADNSTHSVGLNFDKQLDSFQNLKIDIQVSNAKSNYVSNSKSRVDLDDVRINSNNFSTNSNTEKPLIEMEVNHELKFKKQGRFLGSTVAYNMSNTGAEALTNTDAFFYKTETDSFNSISDFLLKTKLRNSSYKGSLVYIEPVIKQNFLLEIGVSGLNNQYVSNKDTYTKPFAGSSELNVLLDSLSNNYNYNVNAFSEYLKFIYKKKKTNMEFGLKLQQSNLNQVSNGSNTVIRNFLNYLPFYKFDWKYRRNANVKFNFRTSIKPPSIEQIQPFRNNTNPFFIVEGNKDLFPSTNYVFSLRNNFSQPLKGTSLWATANLKIIQNDIVSSLNISPEGVRRQNYIQTNGNFSISSNIYYSFIIKNIDVEVNPGFNFNYAKSKSFTNNIENVSRVYGFSPSIEFEKEFDSIVSFDFRFDLNYNLSSIDNSFKTKNNQLSYTIEINNEWQLPGKFVLESGLEWLIYPSSTAFASPNSVALLSADISKLILKNTTEIKFGVYDILNQNRAISRSFSNNNIYESVSDALTRYFMLTVTYKFKNKEKKDQL